MGWLEGKERQQKAEKAIWRAEPGRKVFDMMKAISAHGTRKLQPPQMYTTFGR